MNIWELYDLIVKESNLEKTENISKNGFVDYACSFCKVLSFESTKEYIGHINSLEHLNKKRYFEEQIKPLAKIMFDRSIEPRSYQVELENGKYLVNKSLINGFDKLEAKEALEKLKSNLVETKWLLFLFKAGNFSALIFNPSTKLIERHQTYSRYTNRKKSGGLQVLKDNEKSIHSAGAMIRRAQYNKILEEISELLGKSWQEEIKICRVKIWNDNYLYRNFIKDKLGGELCSFNFETFEPTLQELKRCLEILTSVKLQIMP